MAGQSDHVQAYSKTILGQTGAISEQNEKSKIF
jgi:hypothetical protein